MHHEQAVLHKASLISVPLALRFERIQIATRYPFRVKANNEEREQCVHSQQLIAIAHSHYKVISSQQVLQVTGFHSDPS